MTNLTAMEREEAEDALRTTKMLSMAEILLLSLSVFAMLYFGGRALYSWGYAAGYMSKECGRAECMAEIVRWTK